MWMTLMILILKNNNGKFSDCDKINISKCQMKKFVYKVGNTKFGDQRKRAVTFVKMLLFPCNNL